MQPPFPQNPPNHPIPDKSQFREARVFEELLHPVLLRGPRPDEVDAVAGEVAESADRVWGYEAGPQHLTFSDLAQPYRVKDVGFGSPG